MLHGQVFVMHRKTKLEKDHINFLTRESVFTGNDSWSPTDDAQETNNSTMHQTNTIKYDITLFEFVYIVSSAKIAKMVCCCIKSSL